MENFFKRIGKRLREQRHKLGLTQHDLAEQAGLTPSFVSYLENGTRKGSLDAYIKLAVALKADPEQLFRSLPAAKVLKVLEPSLRLDGLSKPEIKVLKDMVRILRRKA